MWVSPEFPERQGWWAAQTPAHSGAQEDLPLGDGENPRDCSLLPSLGLRRTHLPYTSRGQPRGPGLGHLTPIPALLVLNVTESPTCHQALPRSPPHLLTCPLLPLDLSLHFPGWPFPPFWFLFFSEHWAASEGEQRERAGREGPRGLAKAVPPVCSSLLPCSLWEDAHSSLGTPLYA